MKVILALMGVFLGLQCYHANADGLDIYGRQKSEIKNYTFTFGTAEEDQASLHTGTDVACIMTTSGAPCQFPFMYNGVEYTETCVFKEKWFWIPSYYWCYTANEAWSKCDMSVQCPSATTSEVLVSTDRPVQTETALDSIETAQMATPHQSTSEELADNEEDTDEPIKGDWKTLPSPQYSNRYRHRSYIQWHLENTNRGTLELQVTEMEIEDGYDWLDIYDGDDYGQPWVTNGPRLARLTGNLDGEPFIFFSKRSHLFVTYTSGATYSGNEFQIRYRDIRNEPDPIECGSRLFRCADEGGCRRWNLQCNGEVDCDDGSDEQDCEKHCGQIEDIGWGYIKCSDGRKYGSVCTHTCAWEYELVGPSTRTCTDGRMWSGERPSCKLNQA